MERYLTGISALMTMIIERWRSGAFLLYIRKQVAHFTTKVSDKMLKNKEFFTVPDFYRTIQEATNGAFLGSLSTPENGPPRAFITLKLVSISRQNLHQYMGKLADRCRIG